MWAVRKSEYVRVSIDSTATRVEYTLPDIEDDFVRKYFVFGFFFFAIVKVKWKKGTSWRHQLSYESHLNNLPRARYSVSVSLRSGVDLELHIAQFLITVAAQVTTSV